jgi:hypothetical protein
MFSPSLRPQEQSRAEWQAEGNDALSAPFHVLSLPGLWTDDEIVLILNQGAEQDRYAVLTLFHRAKRCVLTQQLLTRAEACILATILSTYPHLCPFLDVLLACGIPREEACQALEQGTGSIAKASPRIAKQVRGCSAKLRSCGLQLVASPRRGYHVFRRLRATIERTPLLMFSLVPLWSDEQALLLTTRTFGHGYAIATHCNWRVPSLVTQLLVPEQQLYLLTALLYRYPHYCSYAELLAVLTNAHEEQVRPLINAAIDAETLEKVVRPVWRAITRCDTLLQRFGLHAQAVRQCGYGLELAGEQGNHRDEST